MEYLSLEGVKTNLSCDSELQKIVVNFRAKRSGYQINPLNDYTVLTYIDISYSSVLEEEPSTHGFQETTVDIKKKLST